MKRTIENYSKPTPIKWRKIGDYILVLQVLITAQAPAWPIADNIKVWIVSGVNFLGTSIKFWTNTRKEDGNSPVEEKTNGDQQSK